MRTIGITGGVGSGKSELLDYIGKKYRCRIIRSDQTAHELERPGQVCYAPIVGLLGNDVLNDQGAIDASKMAGMIFADERLLAKVNGIVHPAVKEYLISEISRAKKALAPDGSPEYDFLFIEAALLIEERYDLILDEIWYIYADKEIRRDRLKKSRAYSDRKIEDIFGRQLSEDVFREKCRVVIDNSGTLEDAYRQIDRELGEYLC